jgi:hypothetical protein
MGMDVIGKSPASEQGQYFRSSLWWWHPLWLYCEKIAPDLIPADNLGHSNDGWGLDEHAARTLADRLAGAIASGKTQRFEEGYAAYLKALSLEPCKICGGTGYRAESSNTGPLLCNGCGGKGKVPDFATQYPFSVENVREFAAFLRECGGFSIC